MPAPHPQTAASVQRAPDLQATDAGRSATFDSPATPSAAARPALTSTAKRLSEDLGSKPLSRERLDEIYEAVADRLRRELLLSRERNGSLL